MTCTGFDLVPFTQEQLHDALRQMCPKALKAYDPLTTMAMRQAWSAEHPTRFCCYFVSEMVYWYCADPANRIAMALSVPGDATLHRYVISNDNRIDLTCDQFTDDLVYALAKPRMFLQTGGIGPSRRAQDLAQLLGLKEWR